MKKILGIGNALVDILIRIGDYALLDQLDLPKGSMQLVNRLRSDEILVTMKDFARTLAAGGSAANTIHGLAMLGVPTGYVGVTGRDEMGDSFERDMVSAGVEPYLIRSDTETGHAITLITPDSERTFATCLGASVELSAEAVKDMWAGLFPGYDYLHVEGYLVQDHDLVATVTGLAKAAGMTVSLDLASYNVVEANLSFLEEIISRYVDILFANEEEAMAFTGYEPVKAVHHISGFCEVAVVKMGSRGSIIKSKEIVSEIGVLPVRPVDTTGAGDLFAAGFLYGHALGWPPVRCGEAGALLAGHVIEELGAKMPLTRWETVRQILRPDAVKPRLSSLLLL